MELIVNVNRWFARRARGCLASEISTWSKGLGSISRDSGMVMDFHAWDFYINLRVAAATGNWREDGTRQAV